MVCAIATRPKMPGVLSAASMRACARPSRYATDASSTGVRRDRVRCLGHRPGEIAHGRNVGKADGVRIDRTVFGGQRAV
jgi:hypothetical protein